MKNKQRGLGKVQLNERKKTDKKILNYIKKKPGAYNNNIIRGTKINPNSVAKSILRLKKEKKIIPINNTKFFIKIKVPKNSIGYILNYENEVNEYFKHLKNQKKDLASALVNLYHMHFKLYKPFVKKLSKNLLVGIEKNDVSTINLMKKYLGINYTNSSMIGFCIANMFKKWEREKGEMPYGPGFYYDMLPKKLCLINIPYTSFLAEFINHNFPDQIIFNDLVEAKFPFFNSSTKKLIYENFRYILEKRGYKKSQFLRPV